MILIFDVVTVDGIQDFAMCRSPRLQTRRVEVARAFMLKFRKRGTIGGIYFYCVMIINMSLSCF